MSKLSKFIISLSLVFAFAACDQVASYLPSSSTQGGSSETSQASSEASSQASSSSSSSSSVATDESIVVSALKTDLKPNEATALTAKRGETTITSQVTFEIISGADYATINEEVLRINNDKTIVGKTVKVAAFIDNKMSNALTFTIIGVPATSITINGEATTVTAGQMITLGSTILPAESTDVASYQITEGSSYAEIVDVNKLHIATTVVGGEVIKVKAIAGTKESAERTFTVFTPTVEVAYIMLNSNELTIDVNNPYATPKITATVYDNKLALVSDQSVTMRILEGGEDILELNGDTLVAKGHGSATVRVWPTGHEDIYEDCLVSVIVPPSRIDITNQLIGQGRNNVAFTYGMKKWNAGLTALEADNVLDFNLNFTRAEDSLVFSTDYEVSFIVNGTPDATFASYDKVTKKITFNETGTATIKVSTNTGSVKETELLFPVTVNDGINVRTYAEFHKSLDCGTFNGSVCYTEEPATINDTKVINLVNDLLAEPVVTGSYATKELYQQAFIAARDALKIMARGSFEINGNGYELRVADLTKFTYNEGLESIGAPGGILIEAGSSQGYTVEIRDFAMIGLSNVDVQKNFNYGVRLLPDDTFFDRSAHCTSFKVINSSFSGFGHSLNIKGAFESLVENTQFENNHSGHLTLRQTIATVKNSRFGLAGAGAVTLEPGESKKVGPDGDEQASVTFTGSVEVANRKKPNTPELNEFALTGVTVMDILKGLMLDPNYGALNPANNAAAVQAAALNAVSNLVESEMQFNWFIYRSDALESLVNDIANANPDMQNKLLAGEYLNHFIVNMDPQMTRRNFETIGAENAPERFIDINGDVITLLGQMYPADIGIYVGTAYQPYIPTHLHAVFQNINYGL